MFSYALIFVSGLAIGSFLNAVIYRLHSGEGIVKARSHCVTCGHVLEWYELIPVFSFIFQGGRCRACNASISWQYPAVEIATAILFTVVLFSFSARGGLDLGWNFFNLSYVLVIVSLLIIIFVYDLKHYIIPDKIIYPATGIVFLYNLFVFGQLNRWDLFENLETLYVPILAALAASAFFATIFFVSKGTWLGFGDVKLVFFMGLFLGWPGILVALFITFTLGGIIGLGLIGTGKKEYEKSGSFWAVSCRGYICRTILGRRNDAMVLRIICIICVALLSLNL